MTFNYTDEREEEICEDCGRHLEKCKCENDIFPRTT